MRRVVERVHRQRRDDLEPTAGRTSWRHRLMSLGHDPLKPLSRLERVGSATARSVRGRAFSPNRRTM